MGAYMSHGEAMELLASRVDAYLVLLDRRRRFPCDGMTDLVGRAESELRNARKRVEASLTERKEAAREFAEMMFPVVPGPVNPLTDDDLVPGADDLGESHPVSQQGGD